MAKKYSIELVELTDQPALVIKSTVRLDQIHDRLMDNFPRVSAYIDEQGGSASGMPFMRYLDIADDEFVIAAGIPLAEALEGDGDIEAHTLPGGRALTTLHLGDYAAVDKAWEQVWDRAERLGASRRAGGWDVYTNDPQEVAPKEVETRLYLPLGDD